MFYAYVYLDPRKPGRYSYPTVSFLFEPFYVGKGKGRRRFNHLWDTARCYRTHKIKAIKSANLNPLILVVAESLDETDAFKIEHQLISEIGRADLKSGPLTNLTDGGEGAVLSLESRLKISASLRGRKLPPEVVAKLRGRTPWNRGRPMLESVKAALRGTFFPKGNVPYNKGVAMEEEKYRHCYPTMFKKGMKPWNLGLPGKPLTEEQKAAKRAYRHSEETKRIISSRRGWKHSEATKAKISATKLLRISTMVTA